MYRIKTKRKNRERLLDVLMDYVNYLKPKLGMRDWYIQIGVRDRPVDGEPDADQAYTRGGSNTGAFADVLDHSRRLDLFIYTDTALTMHSRETHMVLIHELVHGPVARMDEVVHMGTSEISDNEDAIAIFREAYRQQMELTVDHLAQAFGELIPLPKKILKKLRKVPFTYVDEKGKKL